MQSKNSTSQRGTVIITVLMLIAVATYLAVEITYRQRIDITRTSTLLALNQSEEYVKSAEALAQYVLEQDLIADIKSDEIVDNKKEDWPTKVVKPIGRGLVQGEIYDLQGRFNLNRLLLSTSTDAESAVSQLSSLLSSLNIPTDTSSNVTAAVLATRIQDWVDSNEEQGVGGLESQDYLLLDPPYQAANRLLVDLSELMLVTGLSGEDLDKLAEHVSLLPPQATLNINTASETVLSSVSCLNVAAITDAQADGGLTEADIKTFSQSGSAYVDSTCSTKLSESDFSVKSSFFLLDAKSEVDKKTIHMHSVLYRPETTTATDVKVKVILRKHLDPFSGV